ncbi:succinylglutamate desuccinylase/aspartoacylase [Calothrix sp. NIES-4071]|nr:succinylglutamate desuccinylase/aspartoacylase [Calothrix sp. NIES-4071]BAZ62864.1 succinylglutamate desuccinylase/aspartoacylase [Calothrix sp. NIES-4105]
MDKISTVAIVGGTHGNELTGVYIAKKFSNNQDLITRPSFSSQVLFGNPKAIEQCRRYIDKDLNRCFSRADLQNAALSSYEDTRAKEIQKILLSPQGKPYDVIIDLHTTTSNMGLSVLLSSEHPFLLRLSSYLSSISDDVKVFCSPKSQNGVYLDSLSDLGFAIEVGAVAQGVLNADLFQKTEKLILAALDYFEGYNQGTLFDIPSTLTIYNYIGAIDYPRNARGEIEAMIHPQRQFQDYQPLHPGAPIFITFDGQEISYEGTSTVYPIFINEAAYYEKGVAMCLTQKKTVTIYHPKRERQIR